MARAGPRVTVRVKAFVSKPILRCFLADLSATRFWLDLGTCHFGGSFPGTTSSIVTAPSA